MDLTEEQINRYSRQLILKGFGGKAQEKLLNSKVLIIGVGGLGSPVALYLAAAGISTIGLIDGDLVDITNLQRQIIHFTDDIEKPKVQSAKEKIEKLNPDVKVITYKDIVLADNISDYIRDYDFIIDGTDNFNAKFLINDACVILKKPYSHAGILRYRGQTFTYIPGNMCYRCIFDVPPPDGTIPSCSQAGILGSVAGILGTIQATDCLKYLTGIGDLLTNKLLTIDAFNAKFRVIKIRKDENCPVCGKNPIITRLIDYEQQVCDLNATKNH